MNKRNVLIITSHYPPNIGGVESHLQALVTALNKYGWGVLISTYQPLASSDSAPLIETKPGFKCFRLPWLGFNIVHILTNYPALEFFYLFPGLLILSFLVLVRYFKIIDVIHCQGLVPTAVGILLGKIFKKRVISSTHNLYFFPQNGLYKNFSKIIFSSADQVLTPSEAAKKELIKIGVPKQKIKPFRYWINLKTFTAVNKQIAKTKLGWQGFSIFFVGRLIETKGVNVILKVVQRVKNVNFVIAGAGPLDQVIKRDVNKYSNLKFIGRIENKDLYLYYSAADLVLVPSLVDEGFGFVAMESTACGTPVLASRRGGLSDAVAKSNGMLFEPTVEQMEKSIRYLLSHQNILKKIELGCRKHAQDNFSKENIKYILKAYG